MDKSGNENSHQVIIIYRRPEMNEISAYIIDTQTQDIKDLPLSGMVILKIDDRAYVQKELSTLQNKILLLFASDLKDELLSVSEIYDERYKEFEPFADAAIRKVDLLETKPSKKIYDRLSKDITVLIDQSEEFIYDDNPVKELKVALLVLKAKYSDDYDEFIDILDGLKIDVNVLSFAKKISKKEYDALKKDYDELILSSGKYIVLFPSKNEKSVISTNLDLLKSILKEVKPN